MPKAKLTHIQVKDNGVKAANKIGDTLSQAAFTLEQEIMKNLVKSSDADLIRWQIEQNNRIRLFRNMSRKITEQAWKDLKKDLKSNKNINLNNKQVKNVTDDIGKGLNTLQNNSVQVYSNIVNKAVQTIRSQKTVELKTFLSEQITKGLDVDVIYKDGKHFKFDAYYEMKARTDIQNEIKDNMIAVGGEAGVIFYLSAFFGDCAPDHQDYQGKVYYDKNWRSSAPKDRIEEIQNYIDSQGLMSVQEVTGAPIYLTSRPNCRHFFQFMDIDSVLGAKTKDDVNKLRSDNDLNFNGKYKPEKYKALQEQRQNERKIRAEKREIAKNEELLALNPGDKTIQTKIVNGEAKVRQIQKQQRELISKNSNLDRNYDRESLKGRADFGKVK